MLKGYKAKISGIKKKTEQSKGLGSNLLTTAKLYASLKDIVPKDVRLTSFGIEEKTNVLFEGVARDDQAVVNMMNNFSENSVVNDTKIEAMVEFNDEDRIKLYKDKNKPTPKLKELPKEIISKKFNSSLSLKPVENEIFDNEIIVMKLMGKKK